MDKEKEREKRKIENLKDKKYNLFPQHGFVSVIMFLDRIYTRLPFNSDSMMVAEYIKSQYYA